MFSIYLLIFWIPAIASLVMLWISWGRGILSKPVPIAIWCGVALLFQVSAGVFSPLWAIGLVSQTVLAIYLAVRMKLDL